MTTAFLTNGHSHGKAPQLFDADEVRKALSLILAPGQVTELRALNATMHGDRWPGTLTGYFDDASKLMSALSSIERCTGIYIIPNVVDSSLLARAANRIRKANKNESTSDKNISRRHWLLIDCDAVRPSGISSTDAEHAAAIERARKIGDELHFNYGWPEPIFADSSNGGHLMFRVDLPVEDGGLIERCLNALASKFTDDAVKVDTTVHNPARIWKLYGTRSCKGDSTPDRPHRLARILSAPAVMEVAAI